MMMRICASMIWLIALLAPAELSAADARSRSILYLDQSDLRGPFYFQIFSALRAEVSATSGPHVTLFAEDLDLSRFKGEAYEANLRELLKEKYRDNPIGVIVAVGAATLELVLKWRTELWPNVPIVFAMVEKSDFDRLKPPSDVTGQIVQLKLTDSIKAARAAVPHLKSIVLVGGPWERQVVFGNWKDEVQSAAAGLDVIDLAGLPMAETRERVAALPRDSAIIYSATYGDREGGFYPPFMALSLIVEKANRPIVVASETFLAPGGLGGYVILPSVVGSEAAKLAQRILDGESPARLPAKMSEAVKPVFNWQQMQRWNVSESRLPPGS
jgi:ABC-type uncharacterized transport system substrate-binding protein